MLVGRDPLSEKSEESSGNLFPYVFFWRIWKERNRIAFRDGTLAVLRLKHSFVSSLWSWNSLYIGEKLSSLIGFFGVGGLLLRGW